ncbi:hypothetical protein H6F61_22230 [Cyanobacteria bacterium FACHB-472]|nr:hypothetical protein [Cyanobacteria bacterium FACHB-472]
MVFAVAEPSVSSPSAVILSAILAVCLALVHLFSGKMRFLDRIPRSRWLSAAGGVSVAYIFVHVFPELNQGQQVIEEGEGYLIEFFEHHVYLVALLGFAVFYGLERLAKRSRQQNQKENQEDTTDAGVFWVHMASFSIYNALIGYLLLHREERGIWDLLLFFVAMALHFVVNDDGLRENHKGDYNRVGRWILAAAIIAGWVIGRATEISEAAIAVIFAFIAGGIILNVVKEELPEERESRFWAFALGAAVYSALMVAI